MVRVDLKGIAKVEAKGRTYYYAWRGGPRLRGEPGSPEFIASYNEAIEDRRAPDAVAFRSLVAAKGPATTTRSSPINEAQLVAVARPHWRAFWRAAHCAVRSA